MIKFHEIAEGKNHVVRILHVATGAQVQFPAFITEFSDSYNVNWSGGEVVYGRADPIKTYQNTDRKINIGFDVLAHSYDRARENLDSYGKFAQMLYPVYSETIRGTADNNTRTLKAPPLMRLEFANMVTNTSRSSPDTGLLGCMDSLTFAPNMDSGFFTDIEAGKLYPKFFNISFGFTPQHESTLGWHKDKFLTSNFPYNQRQLDAGENQSQFGREATTDDNVRKAQEDLMTGR